MKKLLIGYFFLALTACAGSDILLATKPESSGEPRFAWEYGKKSVKELVAEYEAKHPAEQSAPQEPSATAAPSQQPTTSLVPSTTAPAAVVEATPKPIVVAETTKPVSTQAKAAEKEAEKPTAEEPYSRKSQGIIQHRQARLAEAAANNQQSTRIFAGIGVSTEEPASSGPAVTKQDLR